MQGTISLVALLLFSVIPVFFLGSSGTMLFLSFMAGMSVVSIAGEDILNIFHSILPSGGVVGDAIVRSGLFLVLSLISQILTKKKVKSSKRWLHTLLVLLVVPLAWLWLLAVQTPGVRGSVMASELFETVSLYTSLLIIAALAWSGVIMYSERHKEDGKHKKH